MDLIISHRGCPDGWAAAYICKKRYPEAEIMLLDHGKNPPYAEVEGKNVIVVDFSWRTREENIRLSKLAKSFQILDHHKTAEAELEGLDFATFDMKRSGAGLAWDYIYGKDSRCFSGWVNVNTDEKNWWLPRPWWVDYTEDRDLWNWALPNSKEVNEYLRVLPKTIESWDAMAAHDTVETATQAGIGIEKGTQYYVREVVGQRQLGTLNGLTVGVVNAQYVSCSEVGNELAKESQIGMSYFEREDGIMQFSLRSIGDIDVSVIAKENGGGGHKNAAGFQLSLKEGRKFVDVVLARYWANNWIEDPRCVS